MRFTLTIPNTMSGTITQEAQASLQNVQQALENFDADYYVDNFVIAEPEKAIQTSAYLQSALISDAGELKRYVIETRLITENDFRHYALESDDLGEIKGYFADYILNEKLPDLSLLEDVTEIHRNAK